MVSVIPCLRIVRRRVQVGKRLRRIEIGPDVRRHRFRQQFADFQGRRDLRRRDARRIQRGPHKPADGGLRRARHSFAPGFVRRGFRLGLGVNRNIA